MMSGVLNWSQRLSNLSKVAPANFASGTFVLKRSKNINIDVKLSYRSEDVGSIIPEQLDAGKAYTYKSPKTIKSLRTYQLGVVYIDEFGRETPIQTNSSATLKRLLNQTLKKLLNKLSEQLWRGS